MARQKQVTRRQSEALSRLVLRLERLQNELDAKNPDISSFIEYGKENLIKAANLAADRSR